MIGEQRITMAAKGAGSVYMLSRGQSELKRRGVVLFFLKK